MSVMSEQVSARAIPTRVWVVAFLATGFLVNAVPHTTAGFLALPLPTPFSGGPGTLSPPMVNVLWGLSNLAIGWGLFVRVRPWFGRRSLRWTMIGFGFAFAVGVAWGVNMAPLPARFI